MMNIPLQMMVVALAGWVNEQQLAVIEYLKEENRVLCEQLGCKRLRFADEQRRRLAAKGKVLGRRGLPVCGELLENSSGNRRVLSQSCRLSIVLIQRR